jgi:hypothetical protein
MEVQSRISSASGSTQDTGATLRQRITMKMGSAQGAIAWSSFFFALLQSICTFFVALDGLRLAIGIGSIALSAGAGAFLDHFHANWIRVPMVLLAFIGALLNLAVLLQIWRLRSRPASRWRQIPATPGKMRMERVQFALSIGTFVLIAIEEWFHLRQFDHF